MKLPVIRHLQKGAQPAELESALKVLEHFSEHRTVTDLEMDVVGELITNICGALEVHSNIDKGMSSVEAANDFAQKVMGSIDQK